MADPYRLHQPAVRYYHLHSQPPQEQQVLRPQMSPPASIPPYSYPQYSPPPPILHTGPVSPFPPPTPPPPLTHSPNGYRGATLVGPVPPSPQTLQNNHRLSWDVHQILRRTETQQQPFMMPYPQAPPLTHLPQFPLEAPPPMQMQDPVGMLTPQMQQMQPSEMQPAYMHPMMHYYPLRHPHMQPLSPPGVPQQLSPPHLTHPPQQLGTIHYRAHDVIRPLPVYRATPPPGFEIRVHQDQQLQLHLQPQPPSQLQLQPHLQPQAQSQLQLQPHLQPQAQSQLHLQLQPQPQLQPQHQPQPQPQPQPEEMVQSRPLQLPYILPEPDMASESTAGETSKTQPMIEDDSTPVMPPEMPHSPSELQEVDDYKDFAIAFMSHRIKLGYNQGDVCQQLILRYGYQCTERTICNFEALQLDLSSVRKLTPVLESWVRDSAKAAGTSEEEIQSIITTPSTSINPRRERRKRVTLDPITREHLETEFQKCHKPHPSEVTKIASRLGLDRDFAKIWFCNRRQRQKRKDKDTEEPTTTVKIPSPSHDITAEIPIREAKQMTKAATIPSVYISDSSSPGPSGL